jgi:hypothetical protein
MKRKVGIEQSLGFITVRRLFRTRIYKGNYDCNGISSVPGQALSDHLALTQRQTPSLLLLLLCKVI